MSTISDDIGLWKNLGLISPIDRTWVKFPQITQSTYSLLRITCFCDNFTKINSYGLIRAKYELNNSNHVSLALYFYPRPDKQLIEVPIPKALLEKDVYSRYFEVMKVIKYRRRIGITPIVLWDIKLEELIE